MKPQYLKIIPAPSESGPHLAQGTKVVTENGVEINGVTKIQLSAEVGGIWEAVIHAFVVAPDELFAELEYKEVTDLRDVSRKWIAGINNDDDETDVELKTDLSALIEAINNQTSAICELTATVMESFDHEGNENELGSLSDLS